MAIRVIHRPIDMTLRLLNSIFERCIYTEEFAHDVIYLLAFFNLAEVRTPQNFLRSLDQHVQLHCKATFLGSRRWLGLGPGHPWAWS